MKLFKKIREWYDDLCTEDFVEDDFHPEFYVTCTKMYDGGLVFFVCRRFDNEVIKAFSGDDELYAKMRAEETCEMLNEN